MVRVLGGFTQVERDLLQFGGRGNQVFEVRKAADIARDLRDRGYYNFSVNNISYRYPYDTVGSRVGDLTMVVKQYLTGYNDRGEPVMENNKVYRISEINMLPGYDPTVSFTDREVRYDTVAYRGLNVVYDGKHNVRPRVLRQAIPLYPNYLYNAEQINRTYHNIMSLGYFKSTRITFDELPAPDSTNLVSYIGNADDSLATQYTQEGYLRCNILGTPQLKQSYKIDLEGTTTSSFYGLKASVGYQNRNLFRGMESFDIAFSIGHEFMKSRDSGKRNAKEFGVTAGLAFPRFLLPFFSSRYRPSLVTPRTRLELSFNYQDRPYYRRTLTSMTWTYSWSNEKYSSFAVRPVDLNLVDMSYINQDFFEKLQNLYLRNSYTSQLVAGISGSYTYNNQLKNPGRNATLVRFNWETAGNLIGGLEHLFSSPAKGKDYYEIFGIQYSQYFRVDLSASRKIMLGEKAAIAGRLYAGCGLAYGNSTSIPFDRLFYCGGISADAAPLTIIDGIEGDINKVNPNDVESISVLKDASAAAVYGARAAYGVILVTTKNGKIGKTNVSYNGRFSFGETTTSTDFETRGYYSAGINDMFYKTYQGVPYTHYTQEDYHELWIRRNDKVEDPSRPWVVEKNGEYKYYGNFDWYNCLFDNTRPTWEHNLTVSGGTEKVKYMLSGNYYNQKGIIRIDPDRFKKYTFRSKIIANITSWFELSNNRSEEHTSELQSH